MKKIAGQLAAAAILVAALLFVPEIAMAETSGTDGNITWVLSDDGALVISGQGDMRSYQMMNYATTAPWGSGITSVEICDGVTSVGAYAFYSCRSLASVTLPENLTSIGDPSLRTHSIPG